MKTSTYAVIMAGGRGTRFWPLSRRDRAKQFLRVTPGGTLIQNTVARIQPLVPAENILVVLGEDQCGLARNQLPGLPAENFIVEPVGRNTAPAIALASMVVSERDPAGVMVVLPADHMIGDDDEFRRVVSASVTAASEAPVLVVLGIRPNRPETGYGYIRAGDPWGTEAEREFRKVRAFTEKPSLADAEAYVAQGDLWNSGMFIWRASVIQDQMKIHMPGLRSALDDLRREPQGNRRDSLLREIYPVLEAVSIDYGVMEKARETIVLPCDFGWNDVGSWSSLASIWKRDAAGNAVLGQATALDSHGCIVLSDNRLVALLDMQDVIVIDTPDAVLICPASSDQKIRNLVHLLGTSSLDRYL